MTFKVEAEKPRLCEVIFFPGSSLSLKGENIAWPLKTILVSLLSSQTLSGRDIEHHLTNVSIFFYNDLVNGTILHTRLGSQLLITSSQDQRQLV